MNHKRGRPKHQRMGCFCKYWKDEREPKRMKYTAANHRAMQDDDGDCSWAEAAREVDALTCHDDCKADCDPSWNDWFEYAYPDE